MGLQPDKAELANQLPTKAKQGGISSKHID